MGAARDAAQPDVDARGLPVMDEPLRMRAEKLGLTLTVKPGDSKPCPFESHKPSWYERGPLGGLNCDVCHPSLETLRNEGYPHGSRNLAPAPSVRKDIKRERWESASSDLAGQDAPGTVLFGSEEVM